MPVPSARVLRAFGLEGQPEALAGGQGTSWRVGNAVLKPTNCSAEELAWQANVLSGINQHLIRIAPCMLRGSGISLTPVATVAGNGVG